MMGGYEYMYGYGWVGMIIAVVLVLGVGALLAWALLSISARNAASLRETPLEILKRRYAGGEISAAEFEQARRALE